MTMTRFAWRELLASKGRVALIALILAIQASALGGGILAFDSLFHTRDFYYEKLHFADLDIQFVPAADTEMPTLEELGKIPGVAAMNRRFLSLGYVEREQGRAPLPVVVHYLDPSGHPPVNDLQITAGEFLRTGHPEDALVDRSFAEYHHVAINDKLVVNPRSFAAHFTVSGIALSPEYLVPTANPDMLIPNKGSLGIIYASREQLDKLFADHLYNDLAFRFAPGADHRTTTDLVLAAVKRLEVERVVPRDSDFGYRYVDEVLGGSRIFMPMMALLLAIMAAIVAFISVNRLIASRRREIGALLAMGYAPRQFIGALLLFGLVPGILGGVLGAGGAIGFAQNLAKTNADVAGLPAPLMIYPASGLLIAALSSVVVGALSGLIPSFGVMRLRPVDALRGAAEIRFTGTPRFLDGLLGRAVATRYALRNVFRRVRLSAATSLLIALAVAMPAGMLTALTSWDAWAKNHTEGLGWDVAVAFKVPLKETQVNRVANTEGLGDIEGYVQGYATLGREGTAQQEMRVRGLAVPSSLRPLRLRSGGPFTAGNADEAILNSAFARNAPPPRVGETITLTYRGVAHSLKVVGVVSDASLLTMFVPNDTAQKIFGLQGKTSGFYGKVGAPSRPRPPAEALPPAGPRREIAEVIDLGAAGVSVPTERAPASGVVTAARTNESPLRTKLLDHDMVATVQQRQEIGDAMIVYLRAFNAVVIPFVALGGLLAFLFVISVLGFLLVEREAEYATLRTLGYERAEIRKLVVVEVLALGGAGLVFSVLSWAGMAYLLRDMMAIAWFAVPVTFTAVDYAAVVVPVFLLLLAAALVGVRSIMRLDLSAALRARAIG